MLLFCTENSRKVSKQNAVKWQKEPVDFGLLTVSHDYLYHPVGEVRAAGM